MREPNGKCYACGKELKKIYSLYCSYECTKNDQQRYVGESIEDGIARRINNKRGLRKKLKVV